MAQVGEWTLTSDKRWITTDARLRYSRSDGGGWMVMAAGVMQAPTIGHADNAALRDAGVLGDPHTGLSLRKLVEISSEITGAVTTLQRDTGDYIIENTPLALYCDHQDGWRFWRRAIDADDSVWSQLQPTVEHGVFKTRRDALEALTVEYRRLCITT